MGLRYDEVRGVFRFVFRSKLAESSIKVLSQLDGQAVIWSTCLRRAGLQSTTRWLILVSKEIDYSTYSAWRFGLRRTLRQQSYPRWCPAQEEHYFKHGEQGSHWPLSASASVLRRRYYRDEGCPGKSGSRQDDITALGKVLEFWVIPDIKSRSRLAMFYRSRLT